MAMKPYARGVMYKTKFQTLIDYYLGDMARRGCTDDSILTNRRTIEKFARFVSPGNDGEYDDTIMGDITDDHVEGYVHQLYNRKVRWRNHPHRDPRPGKLSPFTIRKEIRILRGFGTWLDKEGFENPFSDLVVPKEPKRLVKILSDEDISKILGSINPGTPTGSRLYAIVLFLLDSGPRIGEVAAARLPDLDLEARRIRVIGKGNKERIVPFGSRTGKAFLQYIHLHRPAPMLPEYDQFFLSMDGMPMTRGSLSSVLYRLKKSSGVDRLHAHLFRHSFAVRYLMNGGDVMTLQRILGHESLEVTRRYLSLTSAQIQMKYDSHSPVDRLAVSGLRRFGNMRSSVTP
jgi:integrase/recombinase XerC/integrase/recombinase XerD